LSLKFSLIIYLTLVGVLTMDQFFLIL